ncbi:hypothetical protein PR202_ga08014 [Eleusine coracana subsp. coracana]|uniref:F-box domain-containing protein n=1 Tax=Eleusine coracana subsp. coracana TaxID=191504 RepID=A0AAV5BZ02_ELECO|nr:hypothetical protein PR202_ga08014 [Eleusine coracana subsp. coracana]
MQPPRRTRRSTRSYSVAAAEPSSNRGWLAARRKPSKKRARRTATTIADGEEDDGTPLTDEILVGIFAGLPDLADIVRAAATCRRWRSLVSGESAFISRDSRRTRGIFLCGLALGFFYTDRKGAVPRFTPTASASRRLGLRQPSLNELVDGLDDGLFDSSRLKQMAAMTGAGVVVGNTVYWHARTKVFGLHLDTLVAEHVDMPENGHRRHNPAVNTMLGVSPDGRLRTIQVIEHVPAGLSTTAGEQSVALGINTRSATGGMWDAQEVIPVVQSLPAEAKCVKLRWVGENSGGRLL